MADEIGVDAKDGASAATLSRRGVMAAGVCFAMLSERALAEAGGMTAGAAPASKSAAPSMPGGAKPTFTKEIEADGLREVKGIHDGKGTGRIRYYRFANTPAPAHFIVYDLPPGASEGVHVHFLDDRNKEGAFDEYYYIMSGRGQMEIDGEIVPVAQGDHVHTPLEVAHGIENTDLAENLRVFLTFIRREA